MNQFCEECGNPLSFGISFCESCGTPVGQAHAAATGTKASAHISKSGFLSGVQCHKLFWLHYNEKAVDPATQFRFDQGHEVGEAAKQLFPGGMDVQYDYRDLEGATQSTVEAMRLRQPLFEASVLHQGRYARVDVLNPVGVDEWDIYEVKSSTRVKEVHAHDVAFQKHVAEAFGLKIRDCHLIHIYPGYFRQDPLDYSELLRIQNINEQIHVYHDWVGAKLQELSSVLAQPSCPEIPIGRHCSKPYDCALKERCWAFLPEHNVFSLYRGGQLCYDLFEQGILGLDQLQSLDGLSTRQKIQVECARTGQPHVRHDKLRAFLDRLQYPLYYLDFETLGTAIPLYNHTKTYQQVPFQFSLHVVEHPGATPIHHEYLPEDAHDPRMEFMERLVKLLGNQGSIVAYHAAFEKARLRECCTAFPQYAQWYEAIKERFVCLLAPFRSFYYYNPSQRGSASMKAVLPALTGRNYDHLQIQDGQTAGAEFYRVYHAETTPEERTQTRGELLEYCALDTLGMHWIHLGLRQLM